MHNESAPIPQRVDPVTFEVLYHRLMSITEEMGIQYMRTSGSNVLITGNDAASGIMLEDGSLIAVGPYIVTQGNVLPLIVESTINQARERPGIHDGDVFICNDPYLGAIHQPDVATVAPIFWHEELIAWLGVSGHQLDTGGMDPGGFSIKAVDIHQEGLQIPPVKLVEKGQLRDDVWRWIVNQVRDPLVGLDIKGQLAALNTGRQQLYELIERRGWEVVRAAMVSSVDFARTKLQQRLLELPNGVWREVQYIDHDGHEPHIFDVVCTMTKRGDHLTFDFSGTSPQARGLINSTFSGLQAAVLSAVYILLCWDIPWNKGVRQCLTLLSERGTVNNCAYPAPCAMATISAVIVTIDAVWRCIAQMLLASDRYRDEAMSLWTGSSMAPIFSGTNQHEWPFAATEMSHFGGGGGARIDADGVDTAGIVFNTTPNMPNIEDQEAEYPVLYLFRRHLTDSGGAGEFRGGRSGELAYTVHDAPLGNIDGLFAGTGAEMPNALGLCGGMPGATVRIMRFVQTDLARRLAQGQPLPDRLDRIGGQAEVLAVKHPRTAIVPGDVWYHNWQGAGGYGDPTNREPTRVAEDVIRGITSRGVAYGIYGVVLTGKNLVDEAATVARRAEIRNGRLAQAKIPDVDDAAITFKGSGRLQVGDVLAIDFDTASVTCGHCGHHHCGPSENLLAHLGEIQSPLWAAGPVRGEEYARGRFQLRQLCCLQCGALVDVQVARTGALRPFFRIEPAA